MMLHQKSLKTAATLARLFYCLGMAGMGFQHFMYADSRPVILPPLPAWLHASPMIAYLTGTILIVASVVILLEKKSKTVSLLLGGFLLVVFIAVQCPHILFIQPNSPKHLGLWTDPLKELALAGGAFVMAGLPKNEMGLEKTNQLLAFLEKLIPAGRIFFSITMFLFGLDHFYYTDFVSTLVPGWIPGHTFWAHFAGIMLMCSAVSIILKIWITPVALSLSIMLFIWFIILHIPRAVTDPYSGNGNEITSVFQALAFSGIALAIAIIYKRVNTNQEN